MFRFTFRIIITLQFKDIDLSDKHVKILAVLKPQLDRNYSSQTPTKITLQVAHLQLPPETPKPYSAPCLEYHWIQTIFCQVHGMEEMFLKLCSHRCSFAIHLHSRTGKTERYSRYGAWGMQARSDAEHSCTSAVTKIKVFQRNLCISLCTLLRNNFNSLSQLTSVIYKSIWHHQVANLQNIDFLS